MKTFLSDHEETDGGVSLIHRKSGKISPERLIIPNALTALRFFLLPPIFCLVSLWAFASRRFKFDLQRLRVGTVAFGELKLFLEILRLKELYPR